MILQRCISILAAVGMIISVASVSSAAVSKTYYLAPASGLVTEVSSAFDNLGDTGLTPVWNTQDAPYADPQETMTLNLLVVEWTNDVAGVPATGPVTVTVLDYHHPSDAGVPGLLIVTGSNDVTLAGGTGTMDGSGVVTWITQPTGQVHNELYCENLGGGTLCGAAGGVGLPETGTTGITHTNGTSIPFDQLASPNVASLPMTFSGDFTSVTFEMTIDETFGRQWYNMYGQDTPQDPPALPVLGLPGLVALYSGLAATGGLYIRRRMKKA